MVKKMKVKLTNKKSKYYYEGKAYSPGDVFTIDAKYFYAGVMEPVEEPKPVKKPPKKPPKEEVADEPTEKTEDEKPVTNIAPPYFAPKVSKKGAKKSGS